MNKIDKAFALQSRLITNETRGIYPDTLQDFADLVRADEREACAQLIESLFILDDAVSEFIAKAIRARGNT